MFVFWAGSVTQGGHVILERLTLEHTHYAPLAFAYMAILHRMRTPIFHQSNNENSFKGSLCCQHGEQEKLHYISMYIWASNILRYTWKCEPIRAQYSIYFTQLKLCK